MVEGGGVYIVSKDPITPALKVVKKIYESSDYYMKGSVDTMLSAQKQLLDDADAILQSQLTAVQQTTATHTAEIQSIKDEYVANKGYYNSLATLQAAYPTPKAGDVAYVANVASTTGYYIYNVAGGAWTATSVEAPPVSVPITNYAEHGYTGTPKTLKEVDDETLDKLIKGWVIAEAFAISNPTYGADGNISGAVITWGDGDIGSMSNVVVGQYGITSIRYNRSNGDYATMNVVYDIEGNFESQEVIITKI